MQVHQNSYKTSTTKSNFFENHFVIVVETKSNNSDNKIITTDPLIVLYRTILFSSETACYNIQYQNWFAILKLERPRLGTIRKIIMY